jgi:hypothetical protein
LELERRSAALVRRGPQVRPLKRPSPPKMPAPTVARDALAMATPVTDSVSPYRTLKR